MTLGVTKTLGAVLLALLLSSIIYGITILQTYLYFTKYAHNDRWVLKSVVIVTTFLELFHVILAYQLGYFYLITSFGNVIKIAKVLWTVGLTTMIGTLHVSLIQAFFANRIYILSGKKWFIPAGIMIMSAAQVGITFTYSVKAFRQHWAPFLLLETRNISIAAFSLDIVINISITASMIYYLQKTKTGFSNTKKVLDSLITYTLKTCLIITICSIVALILMVTSKDTFYHQVPFDLLLRFYTNSLLSTLNNRESLRGQLNEPGNKLHFTGGGHLTLSRIPDLKSTPSSEQTEKKEQNVSDV